MPDQHANFAVSTVATAPSPASSGNSLSVASGEGSRFPAVPFNATVRPANAPPDPSNAEIIRVTARSTDLFGTIVRAQEGSSARAIQVGDHISATVTAKTLTDVETDVNTAFSGYKPVTDWRAGSLLGSAAAATTLTLSYTTSAAAGGSFSGVVATYLDPGDYPGNGRTNKLKVQAAVLTNAVAPAVNFTFGLYPIATWGGASNANPTVASLGSVLGAVAINAPAAAGPTIANGSDFTFPAAGWYALGYATSGTTATNSITQPMARLLRREV